MDLDHSRASVLCRGFLTGCSSFIAVLMQLSCKSNTDKSLLCVCYSHSWGCSSWEVPSTPGPVKTKPQGVCGLCWRDSGAERDDLRILLSLGCSYWSGLESYPPFLQLRK